MERSFKEEVKSLRLGAGETFHGEGILAVTKALLQSGVSYVSGYPGAPISHMVDVLTDAADILDELGVHFAPAANEAGAAAMLGASINYPLRGAVAWKSVVGTNVASDALSNLSSAGVMGGALIIVGEDYGEGASIIQERTHAFAMKSQMWLLDPRPDLSTIVNMVEHGFALSEASRTPVMLELRIRACHVHGSFACKDNRAPAYSRNHPLPPPTFDYSRVCLPPSTYAQEKNKIDVRWPAAVRYIAEHRLNETFAGEHDDIGIVVQGGMYNAVIRALQRAGLADAFGQSNVPLYVLNVTYPLIPPEVVDFCAGKNAVLVVEEGQPNYIEQAIKAILQESNRAATKVCGKDCLPPAGEYTGEAVLDGVARFLDRVWPERSAAPWRAAREEIRLVKEQAARLLGEPVPVRPPGFCVGCPERPVLSAIKIAEKTVGKSHVAADVGCHIFATLPPFNLGNTMLGYGLGLSSAAGVAAASKQRVISIMGDGGFWHNGMTTGVTNAVANGDDGILIIMKNGYAAATGGQRIPSSPNGLRGTAERASAEGPRIDTMLKGIGVKWLKTIRSYSVATMIKALTEAARAPERGLKVIIADGECQLARQRRIRPIEAKKLAEGQRVVRTRFGVDADVCTGDHSCIRLSGCPSLTIAPNPDPLRRDPVAKVDNNCVGCGLCGEVAHAAVLCPSFYRADVIQNPFRVGPPQVSGRARPDRHAAAATGARDVACAMNPEPRSLNVIVAALGGEGGGVLSDWLIAAASLEGLAVQSTSIPGVAQRTGATTYYLELFPDNDAPKPPILALTPTPADVDVVAASELIEAGRALQNGYVTPQRTTLIASTNRVFAIGEKAAMADGRFDTDRIVQAAETLARRAILFDMAATAQTAGAPINAVLFGALIGSGALPVSRSSAEEAIRQAKKAIEPNLRGFAAGFDGAQQTAAPASDSAPSRKRARVSADDLIASAHQNLPAAVHDVLVLGIERLVDYQGAAYADLYVQRLLPIARIEERARGADFAVTRETARLLALWMSYEDVIRVADLKTRADRLPRVREEVRARDSDIVHITEFLKPGIDELCSILPPRLGRALLARARARGLEERLNVGMYVRSTGVFGFLLLRLLAGLRWWRPRSLRYQDEQALIERWLAAVARACAIDLVLAREIAECAQLVKGYGDTHRRGVTNFELIERTYFATEGALAAPALADAIRRARQAALADPEGDALQTALGKARNTVVTNVTVAASGGHHALRPVSMEVEAVFAFRSSPRMRGPSDS